MRILKWVRFFYATSKLVLILFILSHLFLKNIKTLIRERKYSRQGADNCKIFCNFAAAYCVLKKCSGHKIGKLLNPTNRKRQN